MYMGHCILILTTLKRKVDALWKSYLGPVGRDPVRWTLLLGAGLLVPGAFGGAKGFG